VRGNILTMGRHGLISPTWTRAKIDSLTYTYTSGTNKLSKINDLAANAYGFNMNGASTSATYTFDNNGNIKIDPYKKISNTTFNYLNLPDIISVTGSPNKEIRFTYDASGVKLRKQITLVGGSPSGLKQDYIDGIEYANDVIESIHFADGRAVWIPGTSTWRYEFNVSDHLGNIRAVVSDMDNDGSLYNDFTTEITQVTSYYPFGLKMEGAYQNNGSALDTKYQYNGKEFNDDLGLNLYDYGKRWYDAALGRFTGVDPIGNKFPQLSTFNYASNNPVLNIDLHGLQGMNSNSLMGTAKQAVTEKWSEVKTLVNKGAEAIGLDMKTLLTGPKDSKQAASISANRENLKNVETKVNKGAAAVSKGVQTTGDVVEITGLLITPIAPVAGPPLALAGKAISETGLGMRAGLDYSQNGNVKETQGDILSEIFLSFLPAPFEKGVEALKIDKKTTEMVNSRINLVNKATQKAAESDN
ncbi:MAG: RHS repeat-associated core domain-containing protein, partial [Saprospiraceae bacterium]